jgi:hypothetical protein
MAKNPRSNLGRKSTPTKQRFYRKILGNPQLLLSFEQPRSNAWQKVIFGAH